MLKHEDIICISSIDWDFIWQQHQEIMSTYASSGNRVLFIENTGVRNPRLKDTQRIKKRILSWLKSVKGFRKERENLYVYSPLILPFPYSRIARFINRMLLCRSIARWAKVMQFNNPVIWTFLPTPIVLDIAECIPHKALVYYCTDNFAATSKSARRIVRYEKKVLQKADAVFAMSRNMTDYCRKFNPNSTRIPMGVNPTVFLDAANRSGERPPELKKATGKIVGYIGGLRDCVDQGLIAYLAKKLPEYTFVFVGPIQSDTAILRPFKNIIFTGRKPHAELPAYIKYFDACIIPYHKDDYTDNVSAAKLNEYLVMGKPVVTTNLKETEYFNRENGDILYIAADYPGFSNLLSRAIKEDNAKLSEQRIQAAINNSWERKIEQMSQILEETISKKAAGDLNWQQRLTAIYTALRKKVTSAVALLLALWLLVFYTPLVWYCAEPLKIKQRPEPSDTILVFAGGVGESGMPGQGYEERVSLAADLYKKGYAKHLIFSSGFTYAFKEPVVMQALAESLGVPHAAIILEDNAKNTYENVRFTKEILDKNHWQKIMLISSPYHMLRTSLVFRRIAKDIRVVYTPVPHSRFYSHPLRDDKGRIILKRITPQQINGILHEYLGILYYLLKGWA